MLRALFRLACLAFLSIAFAGSASAAPISIYVDSAPNAYGSPAFTPWKTDAYADAIDGSFVNMANGSVGANVGYNWFDMRDATVYSSGDLGKRLHFVYWIPNTSIAQLAGFQIAIFYDWAGTEYSNYAPETWVTPTSWVEQGNGVVGSGGFAFWSSDDPATRESQIALWDDYLLSVRFEARFADGATYTLTAYNGTVPEPTTLALLGCGLAGLAMARRRRHA